MLCYWARTTSRGSCLRGLRVHDTMDAGLLQHTLGPAIRTWCHRCIRSCASAIPDTSHVVPRDNLRKSTGLHMPNLDEARVKEEDIWRMPCDVFCGAFPLNRLYRPAGITMSVHIQAKFCILRSVGAISALIETYRRNKARTRPYWSGTFPLVCTIRNVSPISPGEGRHVEEW